MVNGVDMFRKLWPDELAEVKLDKEICIWQSYALKLMFRSYMLATFVTFISLLVGRKLRICRGSKRQVWAPTFHKALRSSLSQVGGTLMCIPC